MNSNLTSAGKYVQYIAFSIGAMIVAQLVFFDQAADADSLADLLNMAKFFGLFVAAAMLVCLILLYITGQELRKAGIGIGKQETIGEQNELGGSVLSAPNQTSEPNMSTKEVVFETEDGVLTFYVRNATGSPMPGDEVWMDGSPAKDGKYRLGFMWYAVVKNHRVVDIKPF